MDAESASRRRPVLDPMERISEILFGLIMVLTCTGSLSAANAVREDVQTMLIGAVGCNLAWGIIDGVFYFLGALADRARSQSTLRGIRDAPSEAEGRDRVADALPPVLASRLSGDELEALYRRVVDLPAVPARVRVHGEDIRGALGVFLLVFLSTFPVVLPFLFLDEVRPALRLSNAVALVMLFFLGRALARYTGDSPTRLGLGMVLLGGALVGLTITFGG